MAEKRAGRGWPAYMTAADTRARMTRHGTKPQTPSGQRVQFDDRKKGCIEYTRLPRTKWYQRVDAACRTKRPVPKYSTALMPHELDNDGATPYSAPVVRNRYAEQMNRADPRRTCATYRRRSGRGIWLKASEDCKETTAYRETGFIPSNRDSTREYRESKWWLRGLA